MSELLWACESGAVLVSETGGVRLVVARAPVGGGFRYQLLRQSGIGGTRLALASGYRQELNDAIAAAEQAVKGFRPSATRALATA